MPNIYISLLAMFILPGDFYEILESSDFQILNNAADIIILDGQYPTR